MLSCVQMHGQKMPGWLDSKRSGSWQRCRASSWASATCCTQSATMRRRVSSWLARALASELGAVCKALLGASLERASPSPDGLRLGEGGVQREPCCHTGLRGLLQQATIAVKGVALRPCS